MRQDGIQLKSTRHAKYQSGHHFVWIPFKRRKIFRDEAIIEATKRYIREAAANNDIEIEAIEIDRALRDHVHVFASFPPRLSASEVVNILKGYSSLHCCRLTYFRGKLFRLMPLYESLGRKPQYKHSEAEVLFNLIIPYAWRGFTYECVTTFGHSGYLPQLVG